MNGALLLSSKNPVSDASAELDVTVADATATGEAEVTGGEIVGTNIYVLFCFCLQHS